MKVSVSGGQAVSGFAVANLPGCKGFVFVSGCKAASGFDCVACCKAVSGLADLKGRLALPVFREARPFWYREWR